MGALEFEPELSRERKAPKIDMKSLADLAMRIYTDRENAPILPDESITMQSLLTVGTSAGGRQPKAIIAINRKNGEIRSGQISGLKDFDCYILKFGNSQYSSAELEMTYYELATKAGIQMMQSELYRVEGNNHFLTKRFDRDGDRKIYTQTLAAIYPDAIIRDVVASLKQFRTIATKYGVSEQWMDRVEATIIDHLKAWGERKEDE